MRDYLTAYTSVLVKTYRPEPCSITKTLGSSFGCATAVTPFTAPGQYVELFHSTFPPSSITTLSGEAPSSGTRVDAREFGGTVTSIVSVVLCFIGAGQAICAVSTPPEPVQWPPGPKCFSACSDK